MAGAQLIQGGVTYNAAGVAHPAPLTLLPGERCYLSFVGTPVPVVYTWAQTTSAGTTSTLSSASSPGPTFIPDVGWQGTITLIDENGHLYQLDIGVAASPSPSANLSYEPVYNIETYGAVASASVAAAQAATAQGVINTAAIQAACDAAQAAGGGKVIIPAKIYALNIVTPATSGSAAGGGIRLLAYSNVAIEGASKYLSLLVHSGTQATVWYPTIAGGGGFFLFRDCDKCSITKLGMVGLYPYSTRQATIGEDAAYRQGVYMQSSAVGCSNCYVTDCYFKNIESESVYIDGSASHPAVNCHVDNNHFYQVASNAFNLGVGTATSALNCSGDDNIIEDCGGSPCQMTGTASTFSRNKISMPSGFYTSSDQVIIVNAKDCRTDDNILRSIHADHSGVAIFNIGFFFDDNTNGISVRGNIVDRCKVLNTGHGGIFVTSASTVGATTKAVHYEGNKLIGCADADHASYPGAQGFRFIGTETTTAFVGGNIIDNQGVTNGLAVGVGIDALTSVAGVVIKPNTFSADVTTPYSLTVAPTVYPQTYTVTNPTTDRGLNVTGDTLAQGLAVLGTLIADLQAQGLIK